MQNGRDTCDVALRDRLAAMNPVRTIVVRGVVRPGVLVEENELRNAQAPADAFCVRWMGATVQTSGSLPLATMKCEIEYWTAGSAENGGMDRGRMLGAMDAELQAALNAAPQRAAKTNYGVSPAVALGTNVFWSDVSFGTAEIAEERVGRKAAVEVFCYQEAGEL